MTPLEITLMVLRGVALINNNPALGGGGIKRERTSALLTMFATLLEGGRDTSEELEVFAKEIQLLVEQHGEPTRGQWGAFEARDVAVRGRLAARREILEQRIADREAEAAAQRQREEDELRAAAEEEERLRREAEEEDDDDDDLDLDVEGEEAEDNEK